MQSFWDALKWKKPRSLIARTCRHAWTSLETEFAGLKVVDGVLVAESSRGLHPLKSASERRPGRKRILDLCKSLAEWRKCSVALGRFYDQGDSVDIDEALAILREGKTKTVNGKPDYKIIRLIRALCLLMNKPMKDT